MKVDYLIIGQGLAGTVMAETLLGRKKKIMVMGDSAGDSASMVAAGLFNPITGKRMVRTWRASELFPFMDRFYSELEKKLKVKFKHSKPIYKPFSSIQEQNFWISNSTSEENEKFVNTKVQHEKYSNYIHNEFGGFETAYSGNIDLPELLGVYREYLISINSYREYQWKPSELLFTAEGVQVADIKADKIIFCEGYKAKDNPFFNWLPLGKTKGEVLTIAIDDFLKDAIVNKSVFVLPTEDKHYKVGSTYKWEFDDVGPTEEGRAEILSKLDEFIKCDYKVVAHEAGIRPTVKDRRPLLGMHPEYPALVIFNGLGTKGVSLAPFFADQLASYLEGNKELEEEVNIKRFYSLYYTI
ncbi:MAG TPA: FAD-dependent oxidoreductase [Cytophagaceae bacterium]